MLNYNVIAFLFLLLLFPLTSSASTVYNYTSTKNFTSTTDYTSCTAPNCQNFTTSQNVSGSFTLSTPLAPSTSTNLIGNTNLLSYSFSAGLDGYNETNSVILSFTVGTTPSGAISSVNIIIEKWQTTAAVGNYVDFVTIASSASGYHAIRCSGVVVNAAGQTVCNSAPTTPTTSIGAGATGSWSPYTVGGSISGLTASGLVLSDTNAGSKTVAPNSTTFTLPTALFPSTSYSVSVLTQPSGQTCTVSNNAGTIATANVTSVTVTCTTSAYTIGGTISGLTGSGLVLADSNAGSSGAISSGATSFTLPTAINSGTSYAVSVQTQPSGQICTVSNGTGTATANVTSVTVTCLTIPTLSITNPSVTYTGSAIPATVTCSSGGAVTNVKYNGSSTVPTNAGTYTVTANCAANGNYSAVTDAAAGDFVINTASQTLTLSPPTATVNAGVAQALSLSGVQGTGQVTYNVSSSGSLTCTLSNESNTGATVTGTNGSGTCSVTATIAADNNYQAATSSPAIVSVNLVPQNGFTLNLSNTSVTTNTPVNLSTTGGDGNGSVTYTAQAQGPQPASTLTRNVQTQSVLQCNISGSVLTPTGGAGVCVVTAVKAADGNYAAASAIGNVTVRAAPLPNPIPTLSEWAQMAMMLLMLVTAGWYGRRMKQR